MLKNHFFKISAFSLLSLFSVATIATENKQTQMWNDMSDPTAIYSNASIGGGTEGVDVSATYGGYLGGVYKHRFDVVAKNDFEYYEVNYLMLNAATKSGITFDSAWDRDVRYKGINYYDVNDLSLGFFAKLSFINKRLNFYPKMSIGYMWADHMSDTTYVEFDATTRFSINRMFWVGVTPTYTYGMKGIELNEWTGTLDLGMQLSSGFGLSASINDDKDISGKVTFAF